MATRRSFFIDLDPARVRAMVKRLVIELGYLETLQSQGRMAILDKAAAGIDGAIDALNGLIAPSPVDPDEEDAAGE